jgi:hypothetical protein
MLSPMFSRPHTPRATRNAATSPLPALGRGLRDATCSPLPATPAARPHRTKSGETPAKHGTGAAPSPLQGANLTLLLFLVDYRVLLLLLFVRVVQNAVMGSLAEHRKGIALWEGGSGVFSRFQALFQETNLTIW